MEERDYDGGLKEIFPQIDKNMSNVALAQEAGITLNIITRLNRNEYVSLESIEKFVLLCIVRFTIS